MDNETMPDPCLLNPSLNTVVTSFSFRQGEGSEKSEGARAVLIDQQKHTNKHNHVLNCFPIPTQKSSLTE